MHRRYILLSVYLLLALTSTRVVNGLPKLAESLLEVHNYVTKRFKRGAVNFHNAIRCYQPTVNVLGSFGTYGCFCGFSGDGKPIDELDKCCQIHDQCYREAKNENKTWIEKIISKTAGEILIAYNSHCKEGVFTCDKDTPYKSRLCECDKSAGECFYYASATYHPQLYNIDTKTYCFEGANFDDLNLSHYENRTISRSFQESSEDTQATERNYFERPLDGSSDNQKSGDKEKLIIPSVVSPHQTDVNDNEKKLADDVEIPRRPRPRHPQHPVNVNFSSTTSGKNGHDSNSKSFVNESAAATTEVTSQSDARRDEKRLKDQRPNGKRPDFDATVTTSANTNVTRPDDLKTKSVRTNDRAVDRDKTKINPLTSNNITYPINSTLRGNRNKTKLHHQLRSETKFDLPNATEILPKTNGKSTKLIDVDEDDKKLSRLSNKTKHKKLHEIQSKSTEKNLFDEEDILSSNTTSEMGNLNHLSNILPHPQKPVEEELENNKKALDIDPNKNDFEKGRENRLQVHEIESLNLTDGDPEIKSHSYREAPERGKPKSLRHQSSSVRGNSDSGSLSSYRLSSFGYLLISVLLSHLLAFCP